MTLRALLLADGPSDLPLAMHLEALCADHGREVQVTPIDPRRLGLDGRTVEDRLRIVLAQDVEPDFVFIHRDAEAQSPDDRIAEVKRGATAAGISVETVVPVVPVRMTEAWLLLDEMEIRRVSGRPSSTNALGLPSAGQAENIADPKALLRKALLKAGDPSGKRRRRQFERDFGRHRALLLQRLDPRGPVTKLSAWQRLDADVQSVLDAEPEQSEGL